jgi:hypothetical protein
LASAAAAESLAEAGLGLAAVALFEADEVETFTTSVVASFGFDFCSAREPEVLGAAFFALAAAIKSR